MKTIRALSLMSLAGVCMAAAGKAGGAAAQSKFSFDDALEIPAKGVFGAREGNSELAEKLTTCPIGKSFLETVDVADTITDPKERAAAFREEQRKLSNRVNGAIRRFKEKNAGYEFAVRSVDDDTLGHGVRIWRVKAA